MSDITGSTNSSSSVEAKVFHGGKWRLAPKLGALYSFGRGGHPIRIKQAIEAMTPVPLSKIGGCSLRGVKNLKFSAVKMPTGESINFLIVITDESRPEFLFELLLYPSVVIELSWDGSLIKSEVLGKLDTLLAVKPSKIRSIPQPVVVTRTYGPKSVLFMNKHQPVGERHEPHCSLTIFNDGKNMYSKSDELLSQLFFQMYHKEVPANSIPGAHFLESTIMFKTFGHTLNGSVVVMLREKYNNWCLTIGIGKGQTLAFYDNHRTVSVVKV